MLPIEGTPVKLEAPAGMQAACKQQSDLLSPEGNTTVPSSSSPSFQDLQTLKPTPGAMQLLLGEEQYQSVRGIMMAQQRTFVQQLYELHKLNQLQKLLSYEVLGYEQGVGQPMYHQTSPPDPFAQYPQAPFNPPLLMTPLTGVCGGGQEEVDTSQDCWPGQQAPPKNPSLQGPPSQQHHHHHHHHHHHQHHQHHHAHQRAFQKPADLLQKPQMKPQQQQQQQPQQPQLNVNQQPGRPQTGFRAIYKSISPQLSGLAETKGEGVGEKAVSASPTAKGSVVAPATARVGRPEDIFQLENIPSALRSTSNNSNGSGKAGEAGSNMGADDDMNTMGTSHSNEDPAAADFRVVAKQSNNAKASYIGSVCAKPACIWPTTLHPGALPAAAAAGWVCHRAGGAQKGHALHAKVQGAAASVDEEGGLGGLIRLQPRKAEDVVGENSGGKAGQQQQQQQLWEQMEQQLGWSESSGGLEHSVQQPEASKLNESMVSWHALLFDKSDQHGDHEGGNDQPCASAPNLAAKFDSSVALAGPKVQAFRATQSSPGLQRQPSTSTLTTDPAAVGGGGTRAFAHPGNTPSGGQLEQDYKGAPTTCPDVFSTGLYTAPAGTAGGGKRGGSGTFLRSPQTGTAAAAVGSARMEGIEGLQPPLPIGMYRPRHSSPPAAATATEGGPPEPILDTMATSGWQSAPFPASHALFQHPQQQLLHQHPQDLESAGMGFGIGECQRPVASAPMHLQWWGGELSTGGNGAAQLLLDRPAVSGGMHTAGASAAVGFDTGLARKRTRLEGGRSSYDAAISQHLQQQLVKPSAFQAVVTRKARSKRGSTNRASGESVCSDSSLNHHQGISRIVGSANRGQVSGGGRGSLDTVGNCMGSVRGGGGLGTVEQQLSQHAGPARCLSRTSREMEVSMKSGSGGSNKRDASALQFSPQKQGGRCRGNACKESSMQGEGVDQSAAGILLALSSGGTF